MMSNITKNHCIVAVSLEHGSPAAGSHAEAIPYILQQSGTVKATWACRCQLGDSLNTTKWFTKTFQGDARIVADQGEHYGNTVCGKALLDRIKCQLQLCRKPSK